MQTAFLVGAAAGFACAALWARVGLGLLRRETAPAHRNAGRVFAGAWLAASGFAAVNAGLSLAAGLGAPLGEGLVLGAAWASVVLGVAMVAGFVAHMAHLATGHPRAVRTVLAIYAVQLVLLVAVMLALAPRAAETNGWMLRFVFERAPMRVNGLLAAFILLPALATAVGHVALLRHASTPTSRWRIGLVSGGLTAWLVVAMAFRLADLPPEWLAGGRVLGALAAVAVLLAYWPPAWAQRRFGVRSIRAEYARPRPPDHELAARRARLAARVRDLI